MEVSVKLVLLLPMLPIPVPPHANSAAVEKKPIPIKLNVFYVHPVPLPPRMGHANNVPQDPIPPSQERVFASPVVLDREPIVIKLHVYYVQRERSHQGSEHVKTVHRVHIHPILVPRSVHSVVVVNKLWPIAQVVNTVLLVNTLMVVNVKYVLPTPTQQTPVLVLVLYVLLAMRSIPIKLHVFLVLQEPIHRMAVLVSSVPMVHYPPPSLLHRVYPAAVVERHLITPNVWNVPPAHSPLPRALVKHVKVTQSPMPMDPAVALAVPMDRWQPIITLYAPCALLVSSQQLDQAVKTVHWVNIAPSLVPHHARPVGVVELRI